MRRRIQAITHMRRRIHATTHMIMYIISVVSSA
jgi:hypothetical protein